MELKDLQNITANLNQSLVLEYIHNKDNVSQQSDASKSRAEFRKEFILRLLSLQLHELIQYYPSFHLNSYFHSNQKRTL